MSARSQPIGVGVKTYMGLLAVLLMAILAPAPARAQQSSSSPSAAASSSAKDTKGQPSSRERDLPVSLLKIRSALEQTPAELLKGLGEKPHFYVEIRERQKIEELLATLSFTSGPVPPGGLYAYEQQRSLFPAVDNPLMQPYAAFSQGELLTILMENLVGRYLVGRAIRSVRSAQRANAEAAAREQVHQAIDEYCAAQPNGGAGIRMCAISATIH